MRKVRVSTMLPSAYGTSTRLWRLRPDEGENWISAAGSAGLRSPTSTPQRDLGVTIEIARGMPGDGEHPDAN
jgi:hypothetical protein